MNALKSYFKKQINTNLFLKFKYELMFFILLFLWRLKEEQPYL